MRDSFTMFESHPIFSPCGGDCFFLFCPHSLRQKQIFKVFLTVDCNMMAFDFGTQSPFFFPFYVAHLSGPLLFPPNTFPCRADSKTPQLPTLILLPPSCLIFSLRSYYITMRCNISDTLAPSPSLTGLILIKISPPFVKELTRLSPHFFGCSSSIFRYRFP